MKTARRRSANLDFVDAPFPRAIDMDATANTAMRRVRVLAVAPEQAAPLAFAVATLLGVSIMTVFGFLQSRAGQDLAMWLGLA